MNLRDLSEALAPLVASMHPLTPCNAIEVSVVCGKLNVAIDTSNMECQIAELCESESRLRDKCERLLRDLSASEHQRLTALGLVKSAESALAAK